MPGLADVRYLGVLLYDADKIEQVASIADKQSLYQAQLDMFLDPFSPVVQAEARKADLPEAWLDAAQKSPIYKIAIDWKPVFPFSRLVHIWSAPVTYPVRPWQVVRQR